MKKELHAEARTPTGTKEDHVEKHSLGQVVAWKFGGVQKRTASRLRIEQHKGEEYMEWGKAGYDEVDELRK